MISFLAYLFNDLEMLAGILESLLVMPEGRVGVPKAPTRPTLPDPVFKLLGDLEVLHVELYHPLIVLQERVCVPEAITCLGLQRLVTQLFGNL
ncbi:hypothetical protein DPMN_146551 [Dreissena polymorpha]|uniref:Uncharacterized protein n=1 Tax=Dreissena polymorpha TaxID=45954 RepID=A0A9D4F842_DREPO|nr:hypothetical protein DPMN_146551 [Dreissena polymorpha]